MPPRPGRPEPCNALIDTLSINTGRPGRSRVGSSEKPIAGLLTPVANDKGR